jgi:inosose dehydratase
MHSLLSRREFVAFSAAGVGAAAMLNWAAPLAAADKDYYGGLPIGIQSYTLRNFNLMEAIRHVEGLGLRYLELFTNHLSPNASAEEIARVRDVLKKANITINAHGVNSFTANHDANRRLFEFAKAAGFRNITADPTPDSFDSLDKLCEEYDVRIAIHNHGPGHRYDKLEHVAQAVKDRHKNVGACVDTGHVLRSNEDPIHWIRELNVRVFALHIKDVAERQNRTHDVVIGTGHLDVLALFRALREIKFPADGSLSLEYESNPNNPIDDVKESLIAAKDAIAKAFA